MKVDGNREKIISRIKKLLALGNDNGATEAEAVAAVLAAQRLMAEADVEDWELHSEDEEPIEERKSEPANRRWRWKLAQAVAPNFRCRFYENKHYESYGHWDKRTVFYGYRSDAEAAAIAFNYLYKTGDRLASTAVKRAYRAYGHTGGVYNGFVCGFVDGVKEELEKQSYALMIATPPKVNESYRERSKDFNKIGDARMSLRFENTILAQEAYSDGMEQGHDAVRARRIVAEDQEGHMLEPGCGGRGFLEAENG